MYPSGKWSLLLHRRTATSLVPVSKNFQYMAVIKLRQRSCKSHGNCLTERNDMRTSGHDEVTGELLHYESTPYHKKMAFVLYSSNCNGSISNLLHQMTKSTTVAGDKTDCPEVINKMNVLN